VSGVSRAKLISLLGVESVIVLHTDNALRALQANLPRNDNGRASVSPPRELTPQLLRLSADCFMPSAAAVAELVAALGIVLNGLEFPPAELTTVAMESLLGASPQQTAAAIEAMEKSGGAEAEAAGGAGAAELVRLLSATFEQQLRPLVAETVEDGLADSTAISPTQT